eukprot:2513312-Prymnesium_polylepis.2
MSNAHAHEGATRRTSTRLRSGAGSRLSTGSMYALSAARLYHAAGRSDTRGWSAGAMSDGGKTAPAIKLKMVAKPMFGRFRGSK